MSFYGRGLGRFGLLPDFSPPAASSLMNAYTSQLAGAISQAVSIQRDIAPLLLRPEGAELGGIVAGIESSISSAWTELVFRVSEVERAKRDEAAVMLSAPKPGDHYENTFADLMGEWTVNLAATTKNTTAALAYAQSQKDALAGLLGQYNSKVPSAAKLVHAAAQAEVAVKVAENVKTATNTSTEAFVAQQQLVTLQKQAAAATAAVSSPGPSPLLIGAGVVGLAGLAFILTRKKRSSVAGYRRRKRSSR